MLGFIDFLNGQNDQKALLNRPLVAFLDILKPKGDTAN